MWQPTSFRYISSDRLDEWEQLMREQVGIPASRLARDDNGSATGSATLPKDCLDDSDYLSE
jgi:hypothetical protein